MKTPRLTDFDPDAKTPALKSPMDGMPAIQKPAADKTRLKAEPIAAAVTPDRSEGSRPSTPKEETATEQFASLLANQQTSKPVNQQASVPANQQTSDSPLSTKQKKKYGTYLREDSILAIRIHAASAKKKDHELLQESVDLYLKQHKNRGV